MISQGTYATAEITNVLVNSNPSNKTASFPAKQHRSMASSQTQRATLCPRAWSRSPTTPAQSTPCSKPLLMEHGPPTNCLRETMVFYHCRGGIPAAAPTLHPCPSRGPGVADQRFAAVATDDGDGSNGDDGVFDNVSIGVGNLFKAPPAARPSAIPTPGIPIAGDCDEAKSFGRLQGCSSPGMVPS